MSKMLVCVDCGHMGSEAANQYKAPKEVEGDNEFATEMVVKMGFVYLGCPVCKSPNLFLQPGGAPTSEEPTETTHDDDDEEIDVSDMVDEEGEEEEVAEEPKPVRKKKKKKKKKVRSRLRISADGGEIKTEYVEDTSVDTNDGIEHIEFKKGAPVPRKMYHRECKTPGCGKDFETKHSMQGHCKRCLKRFTGG